MPTTNHANHEHKHPSRLVTFYAIAIAALIARVTRCKAEIKEMEIDTKMRIAEITHEVAIAKLNAGYPLTDDELLLCDQAVPLPISPGGRGIGL
jgi:hypothetical protein